MGGQHLQQSAYVLARHEQKPNVKERQPDTLTMAYGAWAMPEIVAKLALSETKELHEKTILSLGELFQVHERVAEGVKCGVLPAVMQLLSNTAQDDTLAKTRILTVIELASRNTLGREAICAPLPDGSPSTILPALKGYLQDDDDGVRAVLAKSINNLCTTGAGCQAVFEAGYLLDLIRLARADAGEMNVGIQEVHIQSLFALLTRWRPALETAAAKADPRELVTLLKLELTRGEEYLCKALDMLNAICMEDLAKDKMIRAGGVTQVCVLLHGAKAPPMGQKPGDDGPIPLSTKISWKAKAKLWQLLASLCLRNEGKGIVVDENWLRLILSALNERDSILVMRASIQAVFHISDDPRARQVLKRPLVPILKGIAQDSADTFVRKTAMKAVEGLEWTP